MWEMANLRPRDTGLPVTIWLAAKYGNEKHGPRIKVNAIPGDKMRPGKTAVVTIEENPRFLEGDLDPDIFKKVARFINKNKESLRKVWSGEISTGEFVMFMKRVDERKK